MAGLKVPEGRVNLCLQNQTALTKRIEFPKQKIDIYISRHLNCTYVAKNS